MEHILSGNVIYIPKITTQDQDGDMLTASDSNFVIMLNKIANCIDGIDNMLVVIPEETDYKHKIFIENLFDVYFGGKVKPYYIGKIFDSDIESHNTLMQGRMQRDDFWYLLQHNFDGWFGTEATVLVNEYPHLPTIKKMFVDVDFVFNDLKNDTLRDYNFFAEKMNLCANGNYRVYVLSESQIDIVRENGMIVNETFITWKFMNPTFTKSMALMAIGGLQNHDEIVSVIRCYPSSYFFPHSTIDVSQKFHEIVKASQDTGKCVFVANPTRHDMFDVLSKNKKSKLMYYFFKDKLASYYYMLTKLKSNNTIFNLSDVPNASVYEQMILSDAMVETPHMSKQFLCDGIKEFALKKRYEVLQDAFSEWYWIPIGMIEDFTKKSYVLSNLSYQYSSELFDEFELKFGKFGTGGDRSVVPDYWKGK